MSNDALDQKAFFVLEEGGVLKFHGCWTLGGLGGQDGLLRALKRCKGVREINGGNILGMDTAGAVFLHECFDALKQKNKDIYLESFKEEFKGLMHLVDGQELSLKARPKNQIPSFLTVIGKGAVDKFAHFIDFLSFFGEFCISALKVMKNPLRIEWRSTLRVIEEFGYGALPIVALLLFLIGIVLTYQMGLELKDLGANVFIVNLSGIAILREFSPLITAIIVAGRTSSSFTALISTMKVYEEIDAIKVMGLSPMRRIVLPRVLGLLIVLPLLTVWASVFGILGSMVMANEMLGINYWSFLLRFSEVVEFEQYWIGMSKTPVFALIISIVGCYQGFQGSLSADSVGRQTTKSVVQSIFLIIVTDAFFSVVYSRFGL